MVSKLEKKLTDLYMQAVATDLMRERRTFKSMERRKRSITEMISFKKKVTQEINRKLSLEIVML